MTAKTDKEYTDFFSSQNSFLFFFFHYLFKSKHKINIFVWNISMCEFVAGRKPCKSESGLHRLLLIKLIKMSHPRNRYTSSINYIIFSKIFTRDHHSMAYINFFFLFNFPITGEKNVCEFKNNPNYGGQTIL